jgi:hypothetical protein
MLKIVMAEQGPDAMVLHLEGQLIGPWVTELERVCEPLLTGRAALELELATVSFVSREGAELLMRLRDRHARLLNCSRFVAEQIKTAAPRPANGDQA